MQSLEKNHVIREMAAIAFKYKDSIKDIGLIGGKMGLCINLYGIARFTKDKDIEAMAENIIDEVFDAISVKMPWCLKNGLAGIGWGIEHLVQEKFVEGDTNDILSDIDNRIILQKVYGNNMKVDLFSGFIGFGYYFIKRLQNPNSNDDSFSVLLIKQHLINLIDQLSWFSSHAPLLIWEPRNITKWWPLPFVIRFLCDVFNLYIYPSKVNKLIEWLLLCIENNVIYRHYHKLLLLPNVCNLLNLHIEQSTAMHPSLKNINRIKVLDEIKESEAPLLNTLEVLKMYYILKESSVSLESELKFWHKNGSKNIQIYMSQFKHDPLKLVECLGLLDGFNGFYTILPVLYSRLNTCKRTDRQIYDV